MTIRTTSKFVLFNHAFKIGLWSQSHPPGSYRVDTDEELIEGLSFIAYKRKLTVIHLPSNYKSKHLTRALTVCASDLDIALKKDKAKSGNILEDLHIHYQFKR